MARRNILTLLVSEEEKTLLETLADMSGGGGMSAYVRRLIRQEAQRYGLATPNNGATHEATVEGATA